MFKLTSEKKINLTPEAAGNFIKANLYEFQRPKSYKQVMVLTKAINDGLFLSGEIALAKEVFNGGRMVLMNGQHQCSAVIQSGKPVHANISFYDCDTAEDMALLYRQFDNHKSRSLAELAFPQARAMGIMWPKKVINLVVTAASILENKLEVHKNERIELLGRYKLIGDSVAELLAPKGSVSVEYKHLYRGGVVAAIIITYKKSHKDADIFWQRVRDGEDLKRTMPEYRLRNFLTQSIVEKGKARSGKTKSSAMAASWHEVISKCIHAWNAFRKNEMTELRYFPDKPIPRAL